MTKSSRPTELIELLKLTPHPEGGYYNEVHRAKHAIDPADGRSLRSALTVIYFLLHGGEISLWHRVRSDESWQFIEGDPLELYDAGPGFDSVDRIRLAPLGPDSRPLHVVKADHWQAARTTGEYTLISCAVGPGFDYEDLTMLHDLPDHAEMVREKHPTLAEFIGEPTLED
jgi:uncharacterized protein